MVLITFSSIFVSLTVALIYSLLARRGRPKVYQRTVIYKVGQRHAIIRCRPLTPPADFCLKTTVRMRIQSEQLAKAYQPSGLDLLRRIPTASSSASRSRRCSTDLVASSI